MIKVALVTDEMIIQTNVLTVMCVKFYALFMVYDKFLFL